MMSQVKYDKGLIGISCGVPWEAGNRSCAAHICTDIESFPRPTRQVYVTGFGEHEFLAAKRCQLRLIGSDARTGYPAPAPAGGYAPAPP